MIKRCHENKKKTRSRMGMKNSFIYVLFLHIKLWQNAKNRNTLK